MNGMTTTEIRIEGCRKNIEKSQNTLERHKKLLLKKSEACKKVGIVSPSEATRDQARVISSDAYWAMCDYESVKENIMSTEKKIKEYQERLTFWIQKKASEDKRADVPMIPAVEEFLDKWKVSAEKYYREQVADLMKWRAEYKEYKTQQMSELETIYGYQIHTYNKTIQEEMKQRKIDYRYQATYEKNHWTQDIIRAAMFQGKELDNYLQKELDEEVFRKRIDLYERCSAVVGVITDATGLNSGNNGSINGVVIGENGKAHVETITAGGYNVQCYHYRVLVNPITDKALTQPKSQKQPKKVSDSKSSSYKGKTLQELKELAKEVGADCKEYSDEKIYKMRLIMAIKKVIG